MWVQGQLCPEGTVDPSVRPDPHPRFSERLSEERAYLAGPPPATRNTSRWPKSAQPSTASAGLGRGPGRRVWGWEGRAEAGGGDTVVL